ncbi:cold shock protein CspD [mine drainage metagenome]|uniref:Cold shock protein CspD n=1 Tax=mine drainage metagenome TaxID=410659 RepID=A0A1J5R1D7_9ZZZZ
MQVEPCITFRNIQRSPAVEAKVLERVERLDWLFPNLTSCRVMIEAHHRHQQQGNLFHVRVDVTAPSHELVANREPGKHHAHEDVYVAIRDAFDAMDRQVEDLARLMRADVKKHDVPPHGQVSELVPEADYGRILASDGRSVYFHRNSVCGDRYEELRVGSEVRFIEVSGEQGPQASAVLVVGKHHIVGS